MTEDAAHQRKNSGPKSMEEQPTTPRNRKEQKSKNIFSNGMDFLEEQMTPANGSGWTSDDMLWDLMDMPEQLNIKNKSAKLLQRGLHGKGRKKGSYHIRWNKGRY